MNDIGTAFRASYEAQNFTDPGDPYLWLEQLDSAAVQAWVEQQNQRVIDAIGERPDTERLHQRFLAAYNSKVNIPYVQYGAGQFYNFWRDDVHPRGLLRRTTLAQYRLPEPQWETVLDLDALAMQEGEDWVWGDAAFPEGATDVCLLILSRGGKDASVTREFDLVQCSFVNGGFCLPESKGNISWIDRDTVYVSPALDAGEQTEAGYARTAKRWKRGTALADAELVFAGAPTDFMVHALHDATPGFERDWVCRSIDAYNDELFLCDADSRLVLIGKPLDAHWLSWRDQLLFGLRSDWEVGGSTYESGALIAIGLNDFLAGARNFEVLFRPTDRTSLQDVVPTPGGVVLLLLDEVKSRALHCSRDSSKAQERWASRPLVLPPDASVQIQAMDPHHSDDCLVMVDGFLTPPSLLLLNPVTGNTEVLKQTPSFFDGSHITVTQFATPSADGTAIPYFVLRHKDVANDGSAPALLYGYGGFEVALNARYDADCGSAWLEDGGVYVIANIRGGSEFGPGWHQAALQENRQRSFDDFIAVAQDLIQRKITSPAHLGIMGGSNGGLLVTAVMVQRPELFAAVVAQLPLTDMRRYHLLLAGASWIAEYGDPDAPEQWAYLSRYSPYQNVKSAGTYPRCFFNTSTNDDRVHPGHARKMVARMLEQGHDVLFWENEGGGHGSGSNNDQIAKTAALTWTFLRETLGVKGKK